MIIAKLNKVQIVFTLLVLIILLSGLLDILYNPNPAPDWMLYVRAARLYCDNLPVYNVWIKQLHYANMYLYSPTFLFFLFR